MQLFDLVWPPFFFHFSCFLTFFPVLFLVDGLSSDLLQQYGVPLQCAGSDEGSIARENALLKQLAMAVLGQENGRLRNAVQSLESPEAKSALASLGACPSELDDLAAENTGLASIVDNAKASEALAAGSRSPSGLLQKNGSLRNELVQKGHSDLLSE